ncbi:hypothetical protein AAES_155803 [Amazona aestiva]|uniref:Uncharacterized protein n=1 Tax=Amazona aestiva TaxID=12930 RepID=A0A0Q3LVH3_AMAAE|nr:hypothetical protein AAES_155803 [Amazona aestiva]
MTRVRSGNSALAAPAVSSVGTQTELMRREAAVQISGRRECLHWSGEVRIRNGQGCALCSLVEVLLRQVAELQDAVTRLKGVREAEEKQHCLLQDQTVQGPQASTVAHAENKETANPGSCETVTKKGNKKRRKRTIKSKGLLLHLLPQFRTALLFCRELMKKNVHTRSNQLMHWQRR